MDQRTALSVLNLAPGASRREIEGAFARRVTELRKVAAQAPTPSLRASCMRSLKELDQARKVALDPTKGTTRRSTPATPGWGPPPEHPPPPGWRPQAPTLAKEDTDPAAGDETTTLTGDSSLHESPHQGLRLLIDIAGEREERVLYDGTFRIGRGADNDLALDDPCFSRHHCHIEVSGRRATLVDLGSTNGTLLNGQTVQRQRLQPGDEIVIGSLRAVFAPERRSRPLPLWPLGLLVVAAAAVLCVLFAARVSADPRAWLHSWARLQGQAPAAPPAADSSPAAVAPPPAVERRLEILRPAPGSWLRARHLELVGRVLPADTVVQVAGQRLLPTDDGQFVCFVTLAEGENTLTVRAGSIERELTYRVDTIAPEIEWILPRPRVLTETSLTVRVRVSGDPVRVEVDGLEANARAEGIFTAALRVAEDVGAVRVTAWDAAGNPGVLERPLRIDRTPPRLYDQSFALRGDSVVVRLHADEPVSGHAWTEGAWEASDKALLQLLTPLPESDSLRLWLRDEAGHIAYYSWPRTLLAPLYLARAADAPPAAAIADLERAVSLAPDLSEAVLALAAALGPGDRALSVLDDGLAARPGAPALLEARAEERARAGDFAGAVEDFSALLAKAPDDPALLRARGLARLAAGAREPARADLERVWQLVGPTTEVARALVELRAEAGDLQGAIEAGQEVLFHAPDRALALRVARLELAAGQEDAALASLGALLEDGPDFPAASALRAELRLARNDFAGCIADCDAALAVHPDDAELWLLRSAAEVGRGGLSRALEDTTRAIGAAPDWPEPYVRRAAISLALGAPADAKADCQRALELDPQHERAQHNLERAERELGGE